MKSKNITHRCEQLLEHNKSHNNIRIIKYNDGSFRDNGYWYIEDLRYSSSWNTHYMQPSTTGILFCPCCGKELESVEEAN